MRLTWVAKRFGGPQVESRCREALTSRVRRGHAPKQQEASAAKAREEGDDISNRLHNLALNNDQLSRVEFINPLTGEKEEFNRKTMDAAGRGKKNAK